MNFENEVIQTIVGEQLGAVTFVQNYVQLHFDGPCLTAFTPPTVTTEGQSFRWDEPGYRDALCGQITKIVQNATVKEGQEIRIEFADASAISVSLRYQDFIEGQAEAAMFEDDVRKPPLWLVWN